MPKQRQTCTECSMRRQKCDRGLPCSRCVKRGEPEKCTREWPKEGYDPKVHRIYPRTGADEKASPGSDFSGTSSIPSFQNDSTGVPSVSTLTAPIASRSPFADSRSTSNPNGTTRESDRQPILSFVTWGNTPLDNFKLPAIDIAKELPTPRTDPIMEWNFSNGFGSITSTQTSFLQMLLPSQQQIQQLVEYHMSHVLWCHASIHAPTFRKELAEYSSPPNGLQLATVDMRWAALLFAVMASSIGCAKDHVSTSWGFRKDEKGKLTRQWFKAAVACLNLADYMWKHHIYSLQTICTLTLCGHLMGFSNTQTTLLSAAIKIAQSLGLQKLGHEETPTNHPSNRDKLIRVETYRRVWFQLCIQDWFSIPFSDMYCIQKHHFTTIVPSNYDDETMQLLPGDEPTAISYLVPLQAMGRIMSDCHDAVVTSSTMLTKYEAVLEYEGKINAWRRNLPACIHPDGPVNPSWPSSASWIRRSMEICYAHKIMMIHRNFLGRSFTDSTFSSTRHSCISAAITILHETKNALEDDGPLFWIDHAFMVAAGITLCLDIFHRKEREPECETHRRLVERSINILSKYEESMIAARGIRLLSSLLTEQARTVATQSLDNYNRAKRIRETEAEGLGTTNTTALPFGVPEPRKRPRQKFDVPRFVESLGQPDLFSRSTNISIMGSDMERSSSSGDQTGPDPRQSNREQDESNIGAHNSNSNNRTGSMGPPSYQLSPNTGASSYGIASQTAFTSNPLSAPSIANQIDPVSSREPFLEMSSDNNANTMNNNSSSGGGNIDPYQNIDLGYETFEQFFPPQAGISNSFLFEDLLNFDF